MIAGSGISVASAWTDNAQAIGSLVQAVCATLALIDVVVGVVIARRTFTY